MPPNFVMIGGSDPQRVLCAPSHASTRGVDHKHLCASCGTCWRHSNINLKQVHAHTCPGCGTEVWDQYWNLSEAS